MEIIEVSTSCVQLKTVFRDPGERSKAGGKTSVLPKSYKKKRPVASASGDKVATEKRTKTSTDDDRPRKKAAPTGGQATAAKPSKAVEPVKSANPVVDLGASGSDSDESGDG